MCPLNFFYDPSVQANIQKYMYCEKFSTQAYPGSYEDLPAAWVDFCNMMNNELAKCDKERAKSNG